MFIFKSMTIKDGCNDGMGDGEFKRVMGHGQNLALKHAYFKGNMF